MQRKKLFISTIADDATQVAQNYGHGLELAEFCTAINMDKNYEATLKNVQEKMKSAQNFFFHAPFNELYPAAIDPLAVELVHKRLNQATDIALSLGIKNIVVHSGHIPQLYFNDWYIEKTIAFWKGFLANKPLDIHYYIENMVDIDPSPLVEVVSSINDERLRLCLDIGHANSVSEINVFDWLKQESKYLSHFHIHNNNGDYDAHNNLADGNINIAKFLTEAETLCPNATYTIETTHAKPSVNWLITNKFLI